MTLKLIMYAKMKTERMRTMADKRLRVVCFGDSNTWGYDPATGTRFDEDTRWTGRLQTLLGDGYRVIECGINGRTTSIDEPFRDCRNGCKGLLYSMEENRPFDLLIISLGTNDLKYEGAMGTSRGMRAILRTALHSGIPDSGNRSAFRGGKERILVISPIPLGEGLEKISPDHFFVGKEAVAARFAELYGPICKEFGVEMLDAAQFAQPSPVDCIHMDAEGHRAIAEAVCKKVQEMLAPET